MKRIVLVAALCALLTLVCAAAQAATVKLASADTLAGQVLDLEITGSVGQFWFRDGSDSFPVGMGRIKLDADDSVASEVIALGGYLFEVVRDKAEPWEMRIVGCLGAVPATIVGHALKHTAFYAAQKLDDSISPEFWLGAGVFVGGGASSAEFAALWDPSRMPNVMWPGNWGDWNKVAPEGYALVLKFG